VREYPVLEPLLAMCERVDTGWRFAHKRNHRGEVVAVQGVRILPGRYLEVVRILSHTSVVVARAWLTGPRAGDFILKRQGAPGVMIPLLLSLPEPEA
jgi:hypothetical protein